VSDHTSPFVDTSPSPAPDPPDPPGRHHAAGRLARARWIAVVSWLSATGIQFMVWAAICVATVSVDAPWWLWTFVPGAVVVGVLHLFETNPPPRRTSALSRPQNGSEQR
jgi:hypothetical protein